MFSSFFNMKVRCVFLLESTHRSDSNEYTQHTSIRIKKKICRNYPKYINVCSCGILCLGLKNEFEIAVVNEPSVFEPPEVLLYISECVPSAESFSLPGEAGRGETSRDTDVKRSRFMSCANR